MQDNNSFLLQQQQAIKRMQEMQGRAQKPAPHKMPPAPSFIKTEQKIGHESVDTNPPANQTKTETDGLESIFSTLNIPFLNSLKTDSDISLILGIFLILLAEKSDRLLLIALLYILL